MLEPFSSFEKHQDLKGFHLFHAQSSNCSMRARFLFAEKSLQYVSHIININAQENLHSKYLKIHPNGLVPSLVHDGKTVPGSDNILLYIEDNFPNPKLSPKDPQAIEAMKKWVTLAADFQIAGVKPYSYSRRKTVNKSQYIMSKYANLIADRELVDFHLQTINGFDAVTIRNADKLVYQIYEDLNAQLSQKYWIMGEQFTLADIAWSTPHLSLGRAGFTLEPFPHVKTWVKRLEQRPAYIEQMQFMLGIGQ